MYSNSKDWIFVYIFFICFFALQFQFRHGSDYFEIMNFGEWKLFIVHHKYYFFVFVKSKSS